MARCLAAQTRLAISATEAARWWRCVVPRVTIGGPGHDRGWVVSGSNPEAVPQSPSSEWPDDGPGTVASVGRPAVSALCSNQGAGSGLRGPSWVPDGSGAGWAGLVPAAGVKRVASMRVAPVSAAITMKVQPVR